MSRYKRPTRALDLMAAVTDQWEYGATIADRVGLKDFNGYFLGLFRGGLVERERVPFSAYRYRRAATKEPTT